MNISFTPLHILMSEKNVFNTWLLWTTKVYIVDKSFRRVWLTKMVVDTLIYFNSLLRIWLEHFQMIINLLFLSNSLLELQNKSLTSNILLFKLTVRTRKLRNRKTTFRFMFYLWIVQWTWHTSFVQFKHAHLPCR